MPQKKAYSLEDIIGLSQNQISQKVFTFKKEINRFMQGETYTEIQEAIYGAPNLVDISKENLPSFTYFQIKKGINIQEGGEQQYLLQFIDISSKIFYDDMKAQDDFSSLINSTISHEMRNPLNSIINQCCVQEENCRNLAKLISRIESQIDGHAKNQLNQILSDLRQSDMI